MARSRGRRRPAPPNQTAAAAALVGCRPPGPIWDAQLARHRRLAIVAGSLKP
jgi:hypothetical protein